MARVIKPKLVVFDLDYTLWPFWVDTHADPPFTKHKDGKVYDRNKQHVKFYRDVPHVLKSLHQDGYALGIASRTSCPEEADSLTKLFEWDKYFKYREIYPGCKVNHFKQFQKNSGIDYKDMLFFDDEHRNIVDVGALGVTCILVSNGVTKSVLKEGLDSFQVNNS